MLCLGVHFIHNDLHKLLLSRGLIGKIILDLYVRTKKVDYFKIKNIIILDQLEKNAPSYKYVVQ